MTACEPLEPRALGRDRFGSQSFRRLGEAQARCRQLAKKHRIFTAGNAVTQVETDALCLDCGAAHQDVSCIARIDASVTVDHARAMKILGSDPTRCRISIKGLHRPENDIGAGTLSEQIGKPARRGCFIVIEEGYPPALA